MFIWGIITYISLRFPSLLHFAILNPNRSTLSRNISLYMKRGHQRKIRNI
jgi:hypothetical protein